MTTTIEPTDPAAVAVEPYFARLDVADLAPHPDNPRTKLGDLTELARSIRSKGVLENLTVTPPGDDGKYLIAAGRRRWAAALRAGMSTVPATVRPLTTEEVIEMGLVENGNRADLTLSEELAAVERLMTLNGGLTPAKLSKRIGRSQAWVRARMAVVILPERWRAELDKGGLTLASAEAAATVADLGPEHLDRVCERLAGRGRWQEPSQIVDAYRSDLRRAEAYDAALAKARAKKTAVFTDDDTLPKTAKRLGELFDRDGAKAHAAETCHALVVSRRSWGDGVETFEVCTDPRRHDPNKVGTKSGSDLAADFTPARYGGSGGGRDDSHAKHKARLARLAHGAEVFAKARGGFSQSDLQRQALHSVVREAGQEALKFAATMLGYPKPREVSAATLLNDVDTPAGLVRVAGAVALGIAESQMYWSYSSGACRDYLDSLTGTGWEPDEWTAAVIASNSTDDSIGVEDDEFNDDDPDDDADADDESEVSGPVGEDDD